MQSSEYQTLAGRVDAVGRAVLHVAAALEIEGLIDGPHVSRLWRGAAPSQAHGALGESHLVLQELAQRLDDARAVRRARAR